MHHSTTYPAPAPLLAVALVAALAVACGAVRADEVDDLERPDDIASFDVDAAVYATEIPALSALQSGNPLATTVVLATRLDTSANAVGDAIKPAEVPLVKPTRKPPTSTAARPIPVARASITAPASQLKLVDDQTVELHADGLPTPNAPSTSPFVRVLPKAFDPNTVNVGARWGAQDRLALPIAGSIALSARADMLTGVAGVGANGVRRSLRVTARWDDIDDLELGLMPGVSRVRGNEVEHYVTGLEASTLDPSRSARWNSFVEVSGAKLGPSNIVENSTAQVRAGASWQQSSSLQLDLSVSRGTMDKPDTSSSVGLSMKF